MRRGGFGLALTAITLLAACGEDGAATPRTDAPITYVDDRGVTVKVTSTQRIIPLDGDVAEVIFALGKGDQVVATDLSATFPPEADALPQIGYQRSLNTEPILNFDPTLLIGTETAGPPEVIDELAKMGVPLAIVPTPTDATGPGVKIRAIAEVLGIADAGEQLAQRVQSEIDDASPDDLATSPLAGLRVAMLYIRGESTQLVFGENMEIDWLIRATGATNIAGELGVKETEPINAEALIVAAPDVILATEDGVASVGGIDALVNLPTLAGTPAAKHHAVLVYDAQLMLGNGPRTGQFLKTLIDDLTKLRARLDAETKA